MNGLPQNDYSVTIISPEFFKAAAKVKAQKAKAQDNGNNNTALTSSLDAMSSAGRSMVKRLTPEERKELYIKAAVEEFYKTHELDKDSVPEYEVEEMVRTAIEVQTEELKKAVGETIQKHIEEHPECEITLDELEEFGEE